MERQDDSLTSAYLLRQGESEALLLNVNVTYLRGLMQPATGVEARQNKKKSPSVGRVRE